MNLFKNILLSTVLGAVAQVALASGNSDKKSLISTLVDTKVQDIYSDVLDEIEFEGELLRKNIHKLRQFDEDTAIYERDCANFDRAIEILKKKGTYEEVPSRTDRLVNFEYRPTKVKRKKEALMIFPVGDHNGAFDINSGYKDHFNAIAFIGLLSLEHNIKFVRAGSQKEMVSAIKAYYDENGEIDFLMVGGHGSPVSFQLSSDSLSSTFYRSFIKEDFSIDSKIEIAPYLSSDATVYLKSCSVGDLNQSQNVVDSMAKLLPGRTVVGATVDTNDESMELVKGPDFNYTMKKDNKSVQYIGKYVPKKSYSKELKTIMAAIDSPFTEGKDLIDSYCYYNLSREEWVSVGKDQKITDEELVTAIIFVNEFPYLYKTKTRKEFLKKLGITKKSVNIFKKMMLNYSLNPLRYAVGVGATAIVYKLGPVLYDYMLMQQEYDEYYYQQRWVLCPGPFCVWMK